MGVALTQQGIFNGLTPSEKNKEFVTLRFTLPELYKGNLLPAHLLQTPNVVIPINVTKNPNVIKQIEALTIGVLCNLNLDVEVDPPQNGYQAKLKFNLIQAVPLKEKELQKVA